MQVQDKDTYFIVDTFILFHLKNRYLMNTTNKYSFA